MTRAAPENEFVGRHDPGASGRRPELAVAVLGVLGGWSIAVPYVGPLLGLKLDVEPRLEFIDHVVPGLVVVAVSGLLARLRRGRAGGLLSLSAACTISLAALWITATHVPLLWDASEGRIPWSTASFHTASGPAMLGLSLWLVFLDLRTPDQA